ncbi:flavocytochrome c [Clostridium saudiense]|nr:flavocytochrome c [Clostridium saudiense]
MKKKSILKRISALLLSTTMLFSVMGCKNTSLETSQLSFKTGTYEASAKAHNGDLKVQVEVDDTSIKSVTIIEHGETPNVSDAALEKIPAAIVNTQSVAVDIVSGATYTSNAIIEATKTALQEAGGDLDLLSVKKEQTTKVEDIEKTADVIVVGAGGAGLAAAVSASQNGANVIVIEKMPSVGGNTIISGSGYNAVDPKRQEPLGIEDSIELHYTQTFEGGDKLANPDLVRTLVENAYPALEWLESLGMEYTDNLITVLGGLFPRGHKPVKPLGTGYVDAYMNYINNNNVEVMVETKAEELIIKDGVVTGIIASGANGNKVTLNANNGVILATGGFGANVEMRQKYNEKWPTLDETIKTTNAPGATGDGLVIAEAVNANLVGMNEIQLLPMGDPTTGSLSGKVGVGVASNIFVNKEGNRFVAEDERRDVMTMALYEQTDKWLWEIVDADTYETPESKNNFNQTITELVEQGIVIKADTLEELAEKINVPYENLKASLDKYNEAVDNQGGDEFGRKILEQKIDTAPFYAGPRSITVHHTMGGLEINTSAEVINKDGEIIEGLFAAGEVTGGIHGSNRLGGNALADITVFGKIAGENAAKNKLK